MAKTNGQCIEGPGGLPLVSIYGLNTNQPTELDGAITLGGNVTSTGTNTFSGTNNFSGTVNFTGGKTSVINPSASGTTLLASQAGQYFLYDTALGITYTLPTPVLGAEFNFMVTTAPTTTVHRLQTGNTTLTILEGGIVSGGASSSTQLWTAASSTIAMNLNGTTTGGIVGTSIKVLAVKAGTSGQWYVTGQNVTSGVTATPFSTT